MKLWELEQMCFVPIRQKKKMLVVPVGEDIVAADQGWCLRG
jgi:hypothetical protein